MGLMADTRAMPGPTKIKRGIGLLVIGVLGVLLGAGLTSVDSDPLVVVGLVVIYAGIASALVGLVLLLWGLLRD